MPRLGVVIASVREGRVGRPVADWFIERARLHGHFEIDEIDLKVVNLPIFAEPNHPRLRKYESDQQKTWSARVGSLDAFVFVMPEYNYSTAPALTNAIDYLFFEWNYKPVGLVSYGGISAGLRAAQMVKLTAGGVKMVAIAEAVSIPFVGQVIDKESGTFKATDAQDKSAATMLDELARWTKALATLRA